MRRDIVTIFGALLALSLGACSERSFSEGDPREYDRAVRPVVLDFDAGAAAVGDFWAVPFPENVRLDDAGMLDASYFPNPGNLTILRKYIDAVNNKFDGFGTNSAIYLRFAGELDPSSLPADTKATLDEKASVRLIDISPDSPEFGRQTPLLLHYANAASTYTDAHTLVALPYPGFPLRPKTTYALLVSTGIRDGSGNPLRRSEPFVKRLMLEDAKGLKTLRIDTSAIAGGAIFTTRDPADEMFRTARYLQDDYEADYPNGLTFESMDGPVKRTYSDGTICHQYTGRFRVPNFQQGEVPYLADGGEFSFGLDGKPHVAFVDSVQYMLLLPDKADYDPDGGPLPFVVYAHGTGGQASNVLGVARALCSQGIASIGSDQPLHGDRVSKDNLGEDLLTFNFTNPDVVTHVFQQGALESLALTMLMEKAATASEGLLLPGVVSPYAAASPVRTDPARAMFMGHSQGALTGVPLLAAAGRRYAAAMLSGSSGHLILALLLKTEPVNIPAGLQVLMGSYGDFDIFHPALNLFQMFVEASDPLNYGRYITREAPFAPDTWKPTNVLISEGIQDLYATPAQCEALGTSIGAAWVAPRLQTYESQEILGSPDPITVPPAYGANFEHGGKSYTAVIRQYSLGHFSVTDDPGAWADMKRFFGQTAQGDVPLVGPLATGWE